jgi:hypothetical protein
MNFVSSHYSPSSERHKIDGTDSEALCSFFQSLVFFHPQPMSYHFRPILAYFTVRGTTLSYFFGRVVPARFMEIIDPIFVVPILLPAVGRQCQFVSAKRGKRSSARQASAQGAAWRPRFADRSG